MHTVQTKKSLLDQLDAHYKYAVGEFGPHTKLAVCLHLLGWLGTPGDETPELLRAFISVHRSVLNNEKPDLWDFGLLKDCIPNSYTHVFLAYDQSAGFDLKAYVKAKELVDFKCLSFHTTKENMLTFLDAIEEFSTQGQNTVDKVETKASLLAKINEQYRYVSQNESVGKVNVAMRVLGWLPYSTEQELPELLRIFISVLRSTLNSEEPDLDDFQAFYDFVNGNGMYSGSFMRLDENKNLALTSCVLNEEKITYTKFFFYATKENMLTLLHVLEEFATKTMEKFIFAIVDDEGGVHPVSEWEFAVYDTSSHASKEFRLKDYVLFNSVEEIDDVIAKHEAFNKRNVYTDGHSSPPTALWNGLKICKTKPSAQGNYRISKVVVEVLEDRPTGMHAFADRPTS